VELCQTGKEWLKNNYSINLKINLNKSIQSGMTSYNSMDSIITPRENFLKKYRKWMHSEKITPDTIFNEIDVKFMSYT